jgi:hypothetical protein
MVGSYGDLEPILARRRMAMTKAAYCPCGYVIRANDDEELIIRAQQHARTIHAVELTEEQALAMARPE